MQGFLGSVVPNQIPHYLKQKTDVSSGVAVIYTPSDTTHQYLEHFANFRKGVSTAVISGVQQGQQQQPSNVSGPTR